MLAGLNLPPDTERILFRTRNTDRRLVEDTAFHSDFVAIEADGAKWLVEHGVRLVGIDYLSVAPCHDLVSTHQILLQAGVIPVENLNLQDIAPGLYQFICLPLNIIGSDGGPARVILIESEEM